MERAERQTATLWGGQSTVVMVATICTAIQQASTIAQLRKDKLCLQRCPSAAETAAAAAVVAATSAASASATAITQPQRQNRTVYSCGRALSAV